VPEWEREPTLAEMRPDLEALEKAMALAHRDVTESPTVNMPAAVARDKSDASGVEEMPDITLDHAIEQEAPHESSDKPDPVEAAPAKETATVAPDADATEPGRRPRRSETVEEQLERISAQIAAADTITDIGDTLAERLFGDNVNVFAEQFAAEEAGHDEDEAELQTIEDATARPEDEAPVQSFATDTATGVPEAPQSKPSGLDTAAYERLKTVRALNANQRAAASRRDGDAKPASERDGNTDDDDGDEKGADSLGRLQRS
ncbi:MAG: hypothetical protein KJO56_00460, partial [Gammaproteobacteria bacterium]|nr:hypothetical protein [Gammaproteobacteria bacterium]